MEFQAVVLAGGRGNRMETLTRRTPKCLLPIGNKPMIWYPVRLLEKNGFNEIIIVTLNSIRSRVEKELIDNGIKSKLVIVGFDNTSEFDDIGTAKALALIKDKLVCDCVVVSCDLITNVDIHKVANFYRMNDASFMALLYDIPEQNFELPVPGAKGKFTPESDYIGIDDETKQLIFFGSKDDLENDISLKRRILEKFPNILLASRIQDAHLYFIKKSLVNYIIENKKFDSIKGDFIPHICRKQFSHFKHKKVDNTEEDNETDDIKPKKGIIDYLTGDLSELKSMIKTASFNKKHQDIVSCYCYIQTDGICLRANTVPVFAEANRQAMSKIFPIFKRERTESISRHDRTQIGSDSLVHETSKIGDKSQIKKSVIGKNCNIGEKVKIFNSILMDNVTVSEGAIIQGSVLCSNSKVFAKCEVRDCLVDYSHDISTTNKFANEVLTNTDAQDSLTC